jgi:putative transposase
MKVEISVPEIVSVFKEIQQQPERIYDMIRTEVREHVGQYLSRLMDTELTHFLGRERYEHSQGDVNHRNGSYDRNFTLKGIGKVNVNVPRDRKGDFNTQVIPRSKRYEDELRVDLSMMFLIPPLAGHPHPFDDIYQADRQKDITHRSKQRQ